MPLVKSPVRKGRRSDPSPIKFDEAEGSEEADRAEIADSVANILNTLEDNPGDELTDTGNEISQVTFHHSTPKSGFPWYRYCSRSRIS